MRGVLLLVLGWAAVPQSPLAAQEVATVEVRGEPVFSVAALDTLSAAVRAQRIGERILARLQTDDPLAPLRVARVDGGAAVLVNQDTLALVTPRDAEVATARALSPDAAQQAAARLAQEWAAELETVFQRIAAEERARVVVEGLPAFEVGGTAELRAARRAAAVGVRIGRLAAVAGELPEIRAVEQRRGAAVVAGDDVLVEVSREEAARREMEPLQLAEAWAEEIERVASIVRDQRSPRYLLRVLGFAVVGALIAAAAFWLLGRIRRVLKARAQPEASERWGLALPAARWFLSVLRFAVWAVFAVYVLWLIPRTRPLTYAAGDRTLQAAGRFTGWLLGEGLLVALIVVATVFVARFVAAMVGYLILAVGVRRGGRVALRAGTLAGMASTVAAIIVVFLGIIAVLAYLEIDPVPLLAGAGVAGIAIGFGVQSLIRDFFTGFFILLEDQYGVGDVVTIGGVTGRVERLTLRITQLRGLDGSLTSVPNGEITTVTNLSKDWAQVVFDVNIAFGQDVERATEVIATTAKQLADDWGDRVLGEPEVLGVEMVDPITRAVTLRSILKTAPLERWSVSREIRRRVLEAFAEHGIEVPPRAVITLGDGEGGGSRAGPPPAMR